MQATFRTSIRLENHNYCIIRNRGYWWFVIAWDTPPNCILISKAEHKSILCFVSFHPNSWGNFKRRPRRGTAIKSVPLSLFLWHRKRVCHWCEIEYHNSSNKAPVCAVSESRRGSSFTAFPTRAHNNPTVVSSARKFMTQKDAYHCSNLYCFASSPLETHIRSDALKFMKVLDGPSNAVWRYLHVSHVMESTDSVWQNSIL